jgi:hypothetical protein
LAVTIVTALTVRVAALLEIAPVPATSIGVVLSTPLKHDVTVPRKSTVPDLVNVRFATFPSAQKHAMSQALLFGGLAEL